MGVITLVCKQCGGQVGLDDSREFGFCVHCGTKIIIKDDIVSNTFNTTNNTTNIDSRTIVKNIYGNAKEEKDADELIEDGEKFFFLEDFEQANKAFRKATEIEPSNLRAWIGYARAGGKMTCRTEDGETWCDMNPLPAFKSALKLADTAQQAEIIRLMLNFGTDFDKDSNMVCDTVILDVKKYVVENYEKYIPSAEKQFLTEILEAVKKDKNLLREFVSTNFERFIRLNDMRVLAEISNYIKEDKFLLQDLMNRDFEKLISIADDDILLSLINCVVKENHTCNWAANGQTVRRFEAAFGRLSADGRKGSFEHISTGWWHDETLAYIMKVFPDDWRAWFYRVRKFVDYYFMYNNKSGKEQCAGAAQKAFMLADESGKKRVRYYLDLVYNKGKILDAVRDEEKEIKNPSTKATQFDHDCRKKETKAFIEPAYKDIEKLYKRMK